MTSTDTAGRARGVVRRLRRSGARAARSGQVAVEWLMVAGILTAVAIIVTGILRPTVVAIVRSLARSVRTPGL